MIRKPVLVLLTVYVLCSGCGLPQQANTGDAFSDSNLRADTDPLEQPAVSTDQLNSADGQAMTFAEYLSAGYEQPVTVESYLQEKQTWSDGKTGIFLQDEEGAYYVYNLPCTMEEYRDLNPGQRLRIRGYKTDFSGELQLTDASFSVLNGSYLADPYDVTEIFGSDELYLYLNRRIRLTGLTVESMFDGTSAFYYGWDNTGNVEKESDLYFTASKSGETCTFLVKTQLRGTDSEAYRTVQNLRIGDTVNLEGILSWYNGPQPLVTSITVISRSR